LYLYTHKDFKDILEADWFIEFRNNNDRLKIIKVNKGLNPKKYRI